MKKALLFLALALAFAAVLQAEETGGRWSALASFGGNNALVGYASVTADEKESCRIESFRDGWFTISKLEDDFTVKRMRLPVWKVRTIVIGTGKPARRDFTRLFGRAAAVYSGRVSDAPVPEHVDYFEAVTLLFARCGMGEDLIWALQPVFRGRGDRSDTGRFERMIAQLRFVRPYVFFLLFAFDSPAFDKASEVVDGRTDREGRYLAELRREMLRRADEVKETAREAAALSPALAEAVSRLGEGAPKEVTRFFRPLGRRPFRTGFPPRGPERRKTPDGRRNERP